MAGGRESVEFDFLSHGASQLAGDFKKTGDNAALAAKGARLLADSLDKQRRATDAAGGAAIALAKADKILADAEHVLTDGALEAEYALKQQGQQARQTAEETAAAGAAADAAGGGFGSLGGASGMGAAIAAGIALSPVIATVGVGLGGLGLAALGASKNSKLLGQELAPLKAQFAGFTKDLQPVVLADFAGAVKLAGNVLHDIEPVTVATGKALGGLFAQVDATFASGTWQNFFGFMQRTAGPDIQLLTVSFNNLLLALPPLLEGLQPVARDLLAISAAASKVIAVAAGLNQHLDATGQHENVLAQITDGLRKVLFEPGVGLYQALKLTGIIGATAGKGLTEAGLAAAAAATPVGLVGKEAKAASAHLQDMTTWVNNLNTAETNSLNTQLAYSNALITGATDAQKLRAALKASHDQVGLHTAAERASFSTANTYISDLENTAKQAIASGRGATGAARAIQNGLPILEQAARHNHLLWQEVQTLKNWLDKLRREGPIAEKINVLGLGKWSVAAASHAIAQGPGPYAAGGLVSGGTPGRDSVPIMAMPGEAVVPTRLTPAVAPFLKAHGVPGFASGGIVGSYRGDVAGLPPWSRGDLNATVHSIEGAVARATFAGMQAAAQAASAGGFSGPGGGAPAANAALAYRLYASQLTPASWAAWNYVAMRESGWNQFARNPSSGAYGIAQALPPTKYPFAGQAAGGSNPTAQISWMWNYMAGRYGGPLGAEAHERAFNWYGSGLKAGLFTRPTLIGVGERGPEMVNITPAGSRGGGGITINNLTITLPPGNDREQGRRIVEYIRKFEQGSGSGWRR